MVNEAISRIFCTAIIINWVLCRVTNLNTQRHGHSQRNRYGILHIHLEKIRYNLQNGYEKIRPKDLCDCTHGANQHWLGLRLGEAQWTILLFLRKCLIASNGMTYPLSIHTHLGVTSSDGIIECNGTKRKVIACFPKCIKKPTWFCSFTISFRLFLL